MNTGYIIKDCSDTKSIPLDLLRLADPSDNMLSSYLDRSFGIICEHEQRIIGALLMMETRPYIMEIMNVSVDEAYQNQGIGKRLIKKAIQKAKTLRMKKIGIGTGNTSVIQMLLYQKCGFRIVGIDFDYFRIHYKEKIMENGIECRDMIRMEMILDGNM